jgi:hypothetical protein
VAVGGDGTINVGGETYSTDFPVVGPVQDANRGQGDAFVVRLVGGQTARVSRKRD